MKATIKIIIAVIVIFCTSCSTMKQRIKKNNKLTDKTISSLLVNRGNVFYLTSTYATFSTVWTYSKLPPKLRPYAFRVSFLLHFWLVLIGEYHEFKTIKPIMRLVFLCKHCKEMTYLPFTEPDRASIRDKYGRIISQNCSECNRPCRIDANEIRATKSKLTNIFFIAGFIAAILLLIILNFVVGLRMLSSTVIIAAGVVIAAPVTIAILYNYSETRSVSAFNRYYL